MQVDSKSNLPVHILPASLQGIFPEISLSPIHWHGPVEKHNGQGIPAGLGESGQARSKSKGPQLRILFVTPQALYVCLPQGGVTRFIPMEALYTVVLDPDLLMIMHMTPPHHDLIVRVENQAALDTLLHVVKRLHFMLKGRELTVRGLTTKGGESVLAVTAGGTSTVSGFATGFGPGGLSHQAEERKVTASASDLASALAVQQESLHTHYLTQLQDSQCLIETLQSALDEKDRIIESLQRQSGRYTQPNALDMMSASSPAAVTRFSGTPGTAAASPQHFVPVHSSSVAGEEVESLRTRIVAQDRELASQRELIRYLQEQRACGNDVPSQDVLPNSYRIASSRSRSPGATGVHGVHYPGNLTDLEREVVDLRVELGNCEKALRSAQLLIEELRRDKEVLITQHRNEVTEVRARFLSYERILRRVVEGAQLRSGHHASRHFDSILHLLNTEPLYLGGESASADEHPPPEEEITSRDGAFGSTKRWKGGRGRGRGGQDPPSAVDLMRHTSGDDHYEPAGAKGNPLPFRSTPVPSPVEEELMQLRYKVAQPGPTPSYGIHDTMCLRHEDDVRGLSRFFQNLQDEKAIGPSYSSGVRTPTGLGTSNETSQKKMGEQSPFRLAMNRSSSGAPQRSENLAGNREDIL